MSNTILTPAELLKTITNPAVKELTFSNDKTVKEAVRGFKATYPAMNAIIDVGEDVTFIGHQANLFVGYLSDLSGLNQETYVKLITFDINNSNVSKEMQAALFETIPYFLKNSWCITIEKDLRLFSRKYLADEAMRQIEEVKYITSRRLRYIEVGSPVMIVGGGDERHSVGVLCEAKGDVHLGWTECVIAFNGMGNKVEYKTHRRSEIRPFTTKKNDLDKLGQSLWATMEGKLLRS